MSNRIDQRIVEMSFENQKFERGISQSEKSLKNFSAALATMGRGVDFRGIEQSLQTIAQSFTTMGQIGVGALRRIGESAVNAGMSLFKSLAIAPITQGFGEMELKMNSTQTIMASTGESLEKVNEQLGALNEYSDKTIYSFSDMTENIGKFTNAGVKLETAVASIKGISNAAALSGANANEASRAMYNFAQALSSGSVKLMDWKSIELANMGTVEFKQELMDAAVAAGTLAKESNGMYKVLSTDAGGNKMDGVISATKNFNESLTNQWMTTEVLTSTLSKYSDATTDIGKRATLAATQVTTFSKLLDTIRESVGSGWSQTFEILFGDFNEARALWTGMNFAIGNTVGKMADARNELLSGAMTSGWKQFMQEGITNTQIFGDVLSSVAKESGVDLNDLVKKTGSMENALKGNWLTGEMLTKTVDKMASSIGKMSDEQLTNAGYTEKAKSELLNLRDALKSGSISADYFAKRMSALSGRENIIQGLKNSVVALLNAVRPISKAFDQFFPPMTSKRLYELTDGFQQFTKKLIISEETAKKVQRTFAGVFAILDLGWQTTKFLSTATWELIKALLPMSGTILDTSASFGDFLVMINQIIKRSQVFEYGLLGVKIVALIVNGVIKTTTYTIASFIQMLLSAEHPIQFLGETMSAVFSGIFKTFDNGFRWMGSSFFSSLDSIQQFFSEKLNLGDGTVINGVLESLKDFLSYINLGGADGMVSMSEALNKLDFSRIATFVTGGILLIFINQLTRLSKASADLIESANSFTTKLTKKIFGPVTKFKDLAFAVGVLSASLFLLASVPFDKMKVGLIGLGGAMVIFTASFAAMQAITVMGSKKLAGAEPMAAALNLTAMATGLAVLAIAVAKVSEINPKNVWNSVAVVGAMMGVIVAYQALTVAISLIPGTRAANIGMSMMASGLLGLITIITLMDHIKQETISSSLTKMANAMLMLVGIQTLFALAARVSGGSKVAVNVFGIAGGMLAMIGVIKLINLVKPVEIMNGAKNILILGGVLAGLQTLFGIASRISGGVAFKTNMLAMQVGLVSMIVLTKIAGSLNQQDIQNGTKNIAKMAVIIGALEIVTGLAARIGGDHKLQKILGSISLSMIALTGIIAIIGKFEQSTIDRGYASLIKLTGLIMAIELMTAVIGSIRGSVAGVGVLLGMSITILTLTASLSLLSMIDQEALTQASNSVAKAMIAVGAMGAGLSLMINALSNMTPGLGLLKGLLGTIIPGFLALTMVFGATFMLLSLINQYSSTLKNISWDSLLQFIVGMSAITLLVGAFSQLSKIPGLTTGGGNLKALIPGLAATAIMVLATGGLFAVIGTVLDQVKNIDWNSFTKFIVGLSVISLMVVGLTLLTPAFVLLGKGFKFAMVGVVAAILGVTSVVVAFVGLASAMEGIFGGNSDFLMQGIDKLILVAEGIGRFAGAIAGGFGGQMLIEFGESIAKFSASVGQINPDAFDGISSLAGAMLMLTGTELITGLARFIGLGSNPGELFGKQVTGLISAFKHLNPAEVTGFTEVVRVLTPSMDGFKKLIEVVSKIPNTEGALGAVIGNNDADVFGKQVTGLISAFKHLNPAEVTGFTEVVRVLAPSMTAFGKLIGVASTIPNTGGVAGFFAGTNDIDKFGEKIKKLITSFSTINDGKLRTATTNISRISTAISEMLRVSVSTVNDKGGDLSLSFTKMFDLILKNATKYVGEFTIVGYNIAKGLEKGIVNGQKSVITAADKMAADVIKSAKTRLEVNSPSRVFTEIGTWLPVGLGNGIKNNSKVAILASANMGNGVENALRDTLEVHSESKLFNDIGSWIPTSLLNGIKQTKAELLKAAKDLGLDTSQLTLNGINTGLTGGEYTVTSGINTLLDLLSGKTNITAAASKMGVDTGAKVADGIATGIESKDPKVKGAALKAGKDAFDIMKAGIDKRKEYNLITVDEEIKAWAEFAELYTKGSEMRLKADKELGRVRFEWSKTWIDKEKYYKRLSLGEELKAWETVRDRYEKNSDYRLEAEREVFRLKQEIWQAEYQHELEVIDDAKYYGKMKLKEELASLEKIRLMTEKDSEERKKTDRDIFRVEKEIKDANISYENQLKQLEKDRADARMQAADDYLQKEKDINEQLTRDVATLRDSYDNAVEARAKTLYSSYGIFDKVEEQKAVKGSDLISNLEGQTKAFDEWQNNIWQLTAKGVDDGLVKELREMGPKATAQLVALNSMSDAELSKYVSLWKQKSEDAKLQATAELQSMKESTEAQIVELTIAANEKLSGYKKVWDDTLIDIDKSTRIQLGEIEKEWTASVGSMTNKGISLIKTFKLEWYNEVDTMVSSTRSKLSELRELLASSGSSSIVGNTMSSVLDSMDSLGVGKEITNGLAKGMSSNKHVLQKPAKALGESIHKTMRDFWDIRSPSKLTMETGMYIVLGLAQGLTKFSDAVTKAAGDLGVKASTALSSGVDGMTDLFDVDEDMTITPVIDLSKVKSGLDDMNTMFSKSSGLDLSATVGRLPSVTPHTKETKTPSEEQGVDSNGETKITFTQNNYSPKALSRFDIYRQTQNQISIMKGLVKA